MFRNVVTFKSLEGVPRITKPQEEMKWIVETKP